MIEPGDITPTETTPVAVPLGEDAGIVRAAAVLAIGNVTSRVLGLVREIVKSNLFGASDLLGAYTVAALVPTTLFNLITGGEMVSSSLVPVFSDYAVKPKKDELWSVASMFLSLATVALILIILLVELFAPQVAWLAGARNFENETLVPLTVAMMRLATPAVLFLSIASIITGLLFALRRFMLPAFTAAVFNSTIVVVALLRPDHIDSLVWGLLLGSALQVVLQLPALRDGAFRFELNIRHPAIKRILVLYTPIVAALIVNQIAIWISYNLAITTGDNAVTYMTYATTLYQFPLGLVVTALSIATLPTLSRLASSYHEALINHSPDAEIRLGNYKETLAGGLRLVITLVIPAAAGLFALAGPIIGLLLEHGQFTPSDTEITARVLRLYTIGLPFAALDQMLVFASYARKDTWRPALTGIFSIGVYAISAFLLIEPLGLLSLMVADSIKHIFHTVIMLWLLRRDVGDLSGYRMMPALWKSIVAASASGAAAFFVAALFSAESMPFSGFALKLVIVTAGGGAGVLAYLALVFVLDIRDARSLWGVISRKFS